MRLHFIGDAITYYKEYKEIAARNRQDKSYASPDEQDIESIISFYEEQSFSTELGLAVGAVTGSKKLIQYASQAEQKGDTTMKQWQCITDWENKCERKGELKCVPLMLQTYKNFNISKETALEKITQDFSLSTEEAASFMEKCW
mgnify:CR=1 FL=1